MPLFPQEEPLESTNEDHEDSVHVTPRKKTNGKTADKTSPGRLLGRQFPIPEQCFPIDQEYEAHAASEGGNECNSESGCHRHYKSVHNGYNSQYPANDSNYTYNYNNFVKKTHHRARTTVYSSPRTVFHYAKGGTTISVANSSGNSNVSSGTNIINSGKNLVQRRRHAVDQLQFQPDCEYDIPTFLRKTRLHKYTTLIMNQKISFDDFLAITTEVGLETLGVTAKGARHRLLQAFMRYREQKIEWAASGIIIGPSKCDTSENDTSDDNSVVLVDVPSDKDNPSPHWLQKSQKVDTPSTPTTACFDHLCNKTNDNYSWTCRKSNCDAFCPTIASETVSFTSVWEPLCSPSSAWRDIPFHYAAKASPQHVNTPLQLPYPREYNELHDVRDIINNLSDDDDDGRNEGTNSVDSGADNDADNDVNSINNVVDRPKLTHFTTLCRTADDELHMGGSKPLRDDKKRISLPHDDDDDDYYTKLIEQELSQQRIEFVSDDDENDGTGNNAVVVKKKNGGCRSGNNKTAMEHLHNAFNSITCTVDSRVLHDSKDY